MLTHDIRKKDDDFVVEEDQPLTETQRSQHQ